MGIFRVATYNVNSIRSRLHIVMPWLKKNRPDVFCMQETKVEDGSFPEAEFNEAGYHVVFRGAKAYNGVAVASLKEPEGVAVGLDDEGPNDEDRLIRGMYSGVAVINTYVPQGRERDSEHFAYKLEWFKRLCVMLKRNYAPEQLLIWCGDLNVAPEALDVHDPKRLKGHVCFTPEVWDAFSNAASWGLFDVFRKHHPREEGQYTFFDYRVPKSAQRNLGWRVDHIMATESMLKKSVACTIDMQTRMAEKPSDHTIIYAEFEI